MNFEGSSVFLAALVELELAAKTVRLTDGGIVTWPGKGTFLPRDPDYGVPGGAEGADEQLGDEAPAARLSMLCPSAAAMVALASPANQGAPVRMWIAETDAAGAVVGTPIPQLIGFIDALEVEAGKNSFSVSIELVSEAERLFWTREGNVLSDRFHQRAWPGELGFVFCTGAQAQVPWGVAGPARGVTGVPAPVSNMFA